MMRSVVASLKMSAFALTCLITIPFQLFILLFTRGAPAYVLPHYWAIVICAVFRIKIIKSGEVTRNGQVIYVSNHISYLDIPALSSLLYGSFVAKKDVAGWPVFGFLSKLQQTAFISRERKDAAAMGAALDTMLRGGKNMVIFPEGTSTDGRDIYPFKSSLFSIFLKDDIKHIQIQPITIRIEKTGGRSIESQEDRDLYAWHLHMDTPLHEHLWRFAKHGGAELRIIFHPPITTKITNNRKELAKLCHDAVCHGLATGEAAPPLMIDQTTQEGE